MLMLSHGVSLDGRACSMGNNGWLMLSAVHAQGDAARLDRRSRGYLLLILRQRLTTRVDITAFPWRNRRHSTGEKEAAGHAASRCYDRLG